MSGHLISYQSASLLLPLYTISANSCLDIHRFVHTISKFANAYTKQNICHTLSFYILYIQTVCQCCPTAQLFKWFFFSIEPLVISLTRLLYYCCCCCCCFSYGWMIRMFGCCWCVALPFWKFPYDFNVHHFIAFEMHIWYYRFYF